MEPIGTAVRTWRQKQGWTQAELGQRAGLTMRRIHIIESGKGYVLDTDLVGLSKAGFNVVRHYGFKSSKASSSS